jgi:uncharacterized repeat protein (TIGR03803 family)
MEKVGFFSARNAGILFVICMAAAVAAPAQNFTTLYHFCSLTNCSDGEFLVAGLIQGTDGNFYGTTAGGGANGHGTVFRITPDGTLTTLHSFAGTDGADSRAGLIQGTDGNFYGTTAGGGANAGGTVFRITPDGTLTTLYSFAGTDGAYPIAGLIQGTDGNFYGTTSGGGANGGGTVFRITLEGTLTTLHSFCSLTNCTDGAAPLAGLIQATDGNFYGTTEEGGANFCKHADGSQGCGTVFKTTSAGTLTTLYSFCNLTKCMDGAEPLAGLVQATDGDFYGTTGGGGANGNGTVFRITPDGTLTTLYSFCGLSNCTDGANPYAGLIQATDGNFYGTTLAGGAYRYYGTIFEITPAGMLGTLHSFGIDDDGEAPVAGLIQATDGRFYGTNGEFESAGTIFRLAAVPAAMFSPPSLSFGNQVLDKTSTTRSVTLKNSGTALAIISGVAVEGSGFVVSANTCGGATLGIGRMCKVSVTFTPTVLGNLTGTLTFTDNASNSPQTVPLSGRGVEPGTLMPTSVFYELQAVDMTSAAKTFTLANNQSIALTSIVISTTGDFAVSATTCTTSLVANGKCTISVTFRPTALGTRTGQLNVSDSASNSPQTAALTGTGVEPATLTPASAAYASQAVGTTSAAKTFTLANSQSSALTSIVISTTGDFAVSATTCATSLAAKGKCTISVTFTPTTTGTRTGRLSVSDSASNSPQTSNLTGTGK